MAYLTQSDLENAIGTARLSIVCPDGSGGVSTASVNTVISDAEAEANSILGPGFTVPLTSAAAQIVKACTRWIAIDFAYRNTIEFRDREGRTPTYRDYESAVSTLREIRNGERDMGNEETAGKSAVAGGTVYYSSQNFIVEDETTESPTGGF